MGRGASGGISKGGRVTRQVKGTEGKVGGVLGSANGTELVEWQFSKLLFAVTHSKQRTLHCNLVRVSVCVTETLVSRINTDPVI